MRKKTTEEFSEDITLKFKGEFVVEGRYFKNTIPIKIRHSECGKSFEITPKSLLRHGKCKFCAQNTQKTHEEFLTEFSKLCISDIEVLSEYIDARTKITFRHSSCGKTFKRRPTSFLKRTQECPFCTRARISKESATSHADYLLAISGIHNDKISIISEYVGYNHPIDISCNSCGSEYTTQARIPLQGNGCPVCRESKGEKKIKAFLQLNDIPFERNATFTDCSYVSKLRYDFKVAGSNLILIEYDGKQHFEPVNFFGGQDVFRKIQERDRIKDKYCADNGIPLIRIPYWDFDNIDEILTQRLLPLLEKRAT